MQRPRLDDTIIMGYSTEQNAGLPIKMSAPWSHRMLPLPVFKSDIDIVLSEEIYSTNLHDIVAEKSTSILLEWFVIPKCPLCGQLVLQAV